MAVAVFFMVAAPRAPVLLSPPQLPALVNRPISIFSSTRVFFLPASPFFPACTAALTFPRISFPIFRRGSGRPFPFSFWLALQRAVGGAELRERCSGLRDAS